MKHHAGLLILAALAVLTPAAAQEPVHFPDPILKAAVEEALYLNDPTPADMLGLREFSCNEQGVRDITGLEYADNLQAVNLRFNHISDISVLSELGSLQTLDLSRNQLEDLSPLASLDGLRYLDLHGNHLQDISVLANLTSLQTLVLRYNEISNIVPLASLSNLQSLDLHDNHLSDITALSELTKLQMLDLFANQISDISALSEMTALRNLHIRSNQIEDISILANLTSLTHLYLGNNNIGSISALSGLSELRDLYLKSNQITDISALVGLTKLQTLDLRYNPLSPDMFCSYLNVITQNNPGLITFHDEDCDTTAPSATAPVVDREPATDIGPNSAVLQARVLSDGFAACEGRFRYWIPDEDEKKTPWQSALHGDAFFSQEISSLQPDTTYVFEAELRNSAGTDISSTGSFSTLSDTCTLSVSSSPGGTVVNPGTGDFSMARGRSLPITARTLGPYALFVGWTGSAVDAGMVEDPYDPNTVVLVNNSHTLRANFLEHVIYVDDDAPLDPGPHDLGISDPQENGRPDHPFDAIQEAIASAPQGALVLVKPGTYQESIELAGKGIHVTGIDPSQAEIEAWPVIAGNGRDTLVTFTPGEDGQLSGFVLSGGRHPQAAVIACRGSSPRIRNCLIVGNRCEGPSGAIVHCQGGNPVFENLTVHGNDAGVSGAAFRFADCHAVIVNTILWGNLPQEISVEAGPDPTVSYSNVMGTWPGLGNIALAPNFARSGRWTGSPGATWSSGNYRLMSQNGRWDPDSLKWVADGVTSPCIDAGDPAWPLGLEPIPNGKRINMGAFGGGVQASRASQRLVAHWRFDESVGRHAGDAMGYHDGTVHGAAWTSGKLNGALGFDGVDDYVDCGRHAALAPDQFTLSLWIFPQAESASRTVLQKGGLDAEDYGFELFGAQYPTFSFGNGTHRTVLFSNLGLRSNEWAHVALTRARTEASLYINGSQRLSQSYAFAPPATDHPLILGGSGTLHYRGKIDEFRIHGSALSAEDIKSLMIEDE